MVTCNVCGGENFEKHAGFLYCAECQTQSQDYHEQEYEYQDHTINTIRQKKSPGSHLKKKQKFHDDGMWTTWEAFNYILHGMTEEIKKFGVSSDFELMVFKLWAAYLRECEAVFISRHAERLPKLGYNFKPRDARILYNLEVSSNVFREGKINRSSSRVSSLSTSTKRSASLQKGKIIKADYQDFLSSSMQSSTLLADETLESLGRLSSEGADSFYSSDENNSLINDFKEILRKKDFKMYKNSHLSDHLQTTYKHKCKRDVKLPGKNKLLSIIHLALLLTGSDIQLSDLLRFVREGYLSFAKVTHFFPKDMKLPKNDFSYIEVTSDSLMPTHLRQRQISGQMAYLLKMGSLPVADMNALVDRYCGELNLPDEIANLSKDIIEKCMPSSVVPRKKTLLPSFEAWAMVSIVFVMKLLLGLNDKTEIFLSHLAREINSLGVFEESLFVFEDWQKYIECRKSVLSDFHYPTSEQLNGSSPRSCEKFLSEMMRESKDEYRNERFVPYSKYYIEEKLLGGIKEMLNKLSKPRNTNFFEFPPSLTPLKSNVETIIENMSQNEDILEENFHRPPTDVLQQTFKHSNLQFALNPKNYLSLLKERESEFTAKFGLAERLSSGESEQGYNLSPKMKLNVKILLECSSNYWTLKYPKVSSGLLKNFKEEVFEKTPKNFQWLLTECGRMLEMNVRDIYDELLRLEKKFDRDEEEKVFRRKRNNRRTKKEKVKSKREEYLKDKSTTEESPTMEILMANERNCVSTEDIEILDSTEDINNFEVDKEMSQQENL